MEDKVTLEESPDRTVAVLGISPFAADHANLLSIFSHSKWKLHASRTCAEGIAFLRQNRTPVVICERDLPDGSWKDIMEETSHAANPPAVIVSSRLADDHLWNEVLNSGGFNVLAKPFDQSEVFRDVSQAWLAWKHRAALIRQPPERPKVAGGAG